MKSITILSMKISNFKGIKSFHTEFGQETNILAYNGLGKSTIADAFFWCLWGKDQLERKDHEIKNTVNTDLNRQDHEVEIVFDVDGRHIPIKRVYAEKWTKRRGSNDQEFSGHETTLWFDEVPVPLKDFTSRINDLLEESIFKLITNPQYFNSLNWKERRNKLIDMAGEITNADVAKGNPAYGALLEILKTKSIEDYKLQIGAQRRKINDELKEIEPRIKEAKHNMPEEQDWDVLEDQLQTKKAEIATIDDQISDKSKVLESHYEAEQKRLKEINDLKSKVQNLKWKAEQEAEKANREAGKTLSTLKEKKQTAGSEIKRLISSQESIEGQIKSLQESISNGKIKTDELRAKWHDRNAEEFKLSEDLLSCVACGQPLKGDNLHEASERFTKAFNDKKQYDLSEIKSEGLRYGNAIANKEKQVQELTADLKTCSEKQEKLNSEYYDLEREIQKEEKTEVKIKTFEEFLTDEYEDTTLKIQRLESVPIEAPKVDVSELKANKEAIQIEIDSINKTLADFDTIKRTKARISELEKTERELANKVSELEGIEYTIQCFINDKMAMVEESVNGHFQFVRFKMFNTLVNGGTEETCETMLDDVPWSTLNTGGKLKAGIDIINAFSNYYKVHAPMILDNRESVFEIPYTENQIINLIASEKDKKGLRVQVSKEFATV